MPLHCGLAITMALTSSSLSTHLLMLEHWLLELTVLDTFLFYLEHRKTLHIDRIEMAAMTLSLRPCAGTVYVGDKTQQMLVAINTQTLHTVNILTPGDWQVVGVAVDKHYVYFTTWDQRLVGDLDLEI